MVHNIWSEKIDNILKVGVSLHSIGVDNWALTKSQAFDVIAKFKADGVPILGGDVYCERDNCIEISYDNWWCDATPGEAESEYVVRSNAVALEYVKNYLCNDEKILYAFVPKVTI